VKKDKKRQREEERNGDGEKSEHDGIKKGKTLNDEGVSSGGYVIEGKSSLDWALGNANDTPFPFLQESNFDWEETIAQVLKKVRFG